MVPGRRRPAARRHVVHAQHERAFAAVNPGAWYSYQSDNLFSLIPASLRPASIVNVVMYASGHEYDVFMNGAQLFGGYNDPQAPPPLEATPIATNTP